MTNQHLYRINGMTCKSCAAKIQETLQAIESINTISVDKPTDSATITFNRELSLNDLQELLTDLDPKYSISSNAISQQFDEEKPKAPTKSWFATYQPILLIFGYILGVTLVIQINQGQFELIEWMRHFMAGFFLVFSFFKMMDLKGFAKSYMMYDIIARQWSGWGYLYAFIELGLGIAFLIGSNLLITNMIALIIMSISIIGVLQSVLNKRTIQCACLGAVFDLPMSTVTIIEDGLMIVMSAMMIFYYL